MLRIAIYTFLGIAFIAALLSFQALLSPRKTDRRLIRAGILRRWFRWYRSLWLRTAAALSGWPHIVDVLLGASRAQLQADQREKIWEHGNARIYLIGESQGRGHPVLVVHSFVSQPWILDLGPERSLVQAIADSGRGTYLLDWGDFGRQEAEHDLSHYANVLMEAEREVLKATGASRLHLAGYCLGGTLCLARAGARSHERVASIALIAAPYDLAVPSALHSMMTHPLLRPVALLDGSSGVPGPVVREGFHALRPQALRSVRALIANRRDPDFRRTYDPLSRWVWEHRRLPGGLFFDLVDLYRNNDLYEGSLEVAGELARAKDVHAPLALFIAERDHIVPSASARAVADHVEAELFRVPSGHVSMISGAAARSSTWPRLVEWFEKNDGAASGRSKVG